MSFKIAELPEKNYQFYLYALRKGNGWDHHANATERAVVCL